MHIRHKRHAVVPQDTGPLHGTMYVRQDSQASARSTAIAYPGPALDHRCVMMKKSGAGIISRVQCSICVETL